MLAGLGAGVFLPATYAYVGDQVPYQYRAKTMGLVMSGWGVALVFGVPLGSVIGQYLNWHWSFLMVAAIGLLTTIALFQSLNPRSASVSTPKPATSSQHWRTELIAGFRVPGVPLLLVITFLLMFSFYGMYTYLGSFLRGSLGLSSAEVGGLIMMYGLGFGSGPLTGRLIDRFGKSRSLLLSLMGLVVLIAAFPHLKVAALFGLALLIWGLLNSFAVTSLTVLLSDRSTLYRGRILSLYSFSTYLGLTIGSALLGQIWQKFGYSAAGLTAAAAVAIAVVLQFKQHRRRMRSIAIDDSLHQ
jgi:MFS transporter, DHA1 family, inner membrane transport protein